MTMQIVKTAAGMHLRYEAENQEPVVTQEVVESKQAAVKALKSLAEFFHPDAEFIDDDGGTMFIHYPVDETYNGHITRIPFEEVDET